MTTDHLATAPLAHADTLVLDYLAALWAASEELEPDLRDELMTTVADYIAMRRTETGDDPTAVLHRLGPPGRLADSARRGRIPIHLRAPAPRPVPPRPPAPDRAGADYAAVALLTAGAVVLPGAGPLAGTVMALASARWSPVQKGAATALTVGAMLLSLLILAGSLYTGVGLAGLVTAYLLSILGSSLAGVTLLPGLATRRA